jgi:hypothetical protein
MTENHRHDEAQSKSYDRLFSHVVIASVFTGVQLWALVTILTNVHAGGVLAVALPVLAGGASAGVFLIWREVRALARHLRHTVIDRRNEPIRHHRPDRHLIAV